MTTTDHDYRKTCDACGEPVDIDSDYDAHYGHDENCLGEGACICDRWWHDECCPECGPPLG